MKNLIAWVEIPAQNFDRAVQFYENLLSVDLEKIECGEEKMACLPDDVGAISFSAGFKPSENGVLVSLNTGIALDDWLKRIVENGGKVVQAENKNRGGGKRLFCFVSGLRRKSFRFIRGLISPLFEISKIKNLQVF